MTPPALGRRDCAVLPSLCCVAWATLLAVSPPAVAAAAPRPSVAIQAGLSLAGVDGHSPVVGTSNKRGASGRITYRQPLGAFFSLAPELGVAMRGFSYGKSNATDEQGAVIGEIESLQSTAVLTLAIPAAITVPVDGPVRASLLTGPEMDFEMSERLVTTGAVKGSVKSTLLRGRATDWLVGAGVDARLGSGRVLLAVRGVLGLTRLTPPPFSPRTRAFELELGYSIDL